MEVQDRKPSREMAEIEGSEKVVRGGDQFSKYLVNLVGQRKKEKGEVKGLKERCSCTTPGAIRVWRMRNC